MTKSKIQWTDETWNPVRGCSRSSPGCDHRYAMNQAHRFSGPGQPYEGLTTLRNGRTDWVGRVRFVPEQLDKPLRWKRPRRVFVNSMSDLFHPGFTNEEIAAVFGVMAAAPQHIFQVLTKRAERMREWFAWAQKRGEDGARLFDEDPLDWRIRQLLHVSARRAGVDMNADARQNHGGPWPLPNVHLGVSAENQETADERIPHLLATPVAVRFVSAEPLIGPVDLNAIQIPEERAGLRFSSLTRQHDARYGTSDTLVSWVIIGGESGPDARPCDVAWIRSIVTQCREADVPVFVKQLGSRVFAPWLVQWRPTGRGGFEADVEGRPKDSFATVWPNGTWHTWDADGVGGENDSEPTVEAARAAALEALARQHVRPIKGWRRHLHMLRHPKGADPTEWPEDLQVRQWP